MIYHEQYGDLFELDKKYTFVQCTSADLKMGAGISLQFNKHFNVKRMLMEMYPNGYYGYGCIKYKNVLNLVTKMKYYEKPTILSMTKALDEMKAIVIIESIRHIAMPMIGCGLDRLDWCDVSNIIKKIFNDLDVVIIVMIK